MIRQLDLLKEYNCTEILTEKMSGTKTNRPGDPIVVASFSRLGRSTKDLIELVEYFENKNVKLISIKENFDTNTPQGKLMLTVFQAFSQFERDLIAQRTKEGLESARTRGRNRGRPRVTEKQINKALNLYHSKEYSISEIVEMTGISQATLYRYIQTARKGKEKQAHIDLENIAKIRMGLQIENNIKFVRGKGKVRESIEQFLKHHYRMEIIANEYIIYVPYTTVDALKKSVYAILGEMDSEADMRNYFIDANVYCDELGLTW
nr:recombinase family protein [Bacillus cereus]